MDERIDVLTYAVRRNVVLKYCGQLTSVLAFLMVAPLVVAVIEAEWVPARRFAVLCAVLFLLAKRLARLPVPPNIQDNEALTITAAVFLISPLLMSWPMMAAGISFNDALFEAVSGITTTGLSVLGNVEHRSATLLFTRAWMQWYGGLGIVVLSVALLRGHDAAARRLADPVARGEGLLATARTHARQCVLVYSCLTVLGLAVVWLVTGDGFNSMLHVLAAVSTGGFSSFNNSLAGLGSSYAVTALMVISFLGAVSLPLYWRTIHSGWSGGARTFFRDIELRALLAGGLTVGVLLIWLASKHGVSAPWYQWMAMGFSAQTTTGFSVMGVAGLDPVSKLVMIVSMLVGGSVGSSAGGFKLLRLLIVLRMLQLMLRRLAMPPHAVAEPYLAGQKLETDDLLRALQLVLLFIGIVVASWLPFIAQGYNPLDALFEVVSACGTVGLSVGIVRPELATLLKGVLCFDMLAGRLEIMALLVLLYPRTWFSRREATK